MYGGNPNARYPQPKAFQNAPFKSTHAPTNPYGFGKQSVAGRLQLPQMGAGPQNRGQIRSQIGLPDYEEYLRQLFGAQSAAPGARGPVGY